MCTPRVQLSINSLMCVSLRTLRVDMYSKVAVFNTYNQQITLETTVQSNRLYMGHLTSFAFLRYGFPPIAFQFISRTP